MRALHFMKVDYILTRKQFSIVPLFFGLALFVGHGMGTPELSLMVACSYMLFVASIFATTPFAYCGGKNRGFLLLFPATVRDRVAGRFLYGMSFMALLTLFCGALAGVYRVMGMKLSLWTLAIGLWELAIGIMIITLQILFFYLFGEGKENWQYLSNIVRTAPGMAVFFGANYLIGKAEDASAGGAKIALGALSGKFMQAGVVAIVASLLLTAVAAAVCVKVVRKRDYA